MQTIKILVHNHPNHIQKPSKQQTNQKTKIHLPLLCSKEQDTLPFHPLSSQTCIYQVSGMQLAVIEHGGKGEQESGSRMQTYKPLLWASHQNMGHMPIEAWHPGTGLWIEYFCLFTAHPGNVFTPIICLLVWIHTPSYFYSLQRVFHYNKTILKQTHSNHRNLNNCHSSSKSLNMDPR